MLDVVEQPRVSFVVAMTPAHVIGRSGQLPWHIPADLAHFRHMAIGKPIVMGRRTFEAIGRPLPGRHNIIVTRDGNYLVEGGTVVGNVDDALTAAGDVPEIAVIGGAQIFRSCCRGRMFCTLYPDSLSFRFLVDGEVVSDSGSCMVQGGFLSGEQRAHLEALVRRPTRAAWHRAAGQRDAACSTTG